MQKIQRLSRYFKWLFQASFVIITLLYLSFWGYFVIYNSWPFSNVLQHLNHLSSHHPLPSIYDIKTRILCATVSLIPLTVTLIINALLIRLFALYQQGKIFAYKNVRTIKHIGYMLLISQGANIIYQVLFSIVVTWQYGPGHRLASFQLSGTSISMIITACIVILISWVMAEACKLQEDSQYTI
jgi:hypothetical protein